MPGPPAESEYMPTSDPEVTSRVPLVAQKAPPLMAVVFKVAVAALPSRSMENTIMGSGPDELLADSPLLVRAEPDMTEANALPAANSNTLAATADFNCLLRNISVPLFAWEAFCSWRRRSDPQTMPIPEGPAKTKGCLASGETEVSTVRIPDAARRGLRPRQDSPDLRGAGVAVRSIRS